VPVYGEGGASCQKNINSASRLNFETMSKRRRGYPSETSVKRGLQIVHGDKELFEKLGRNDLCPLVLLDIKILKLKENRFGLYRKSIRYNRIKVKNRGYCAKE
jgi:hypothetical protein